VKRCRRWIQLIHLYRSGEIGDADRTRLERHLMNCPRCTRLLDSMAELEQRVAPLRRSRPTPPDPEQLTQNIIERIVRPGVREPAAVSLLSWLSRPRIRLALCSAIILIPGFYIVQEWGTLRRVQQLERRLADLPEKPREISLPGIRSLTAEAIVSRGNLSSPARIRTLVDVAEKLSRLARIRTQGDLAGRLRTLIRIRGPEGRPELFRMMNDF